MATTASQASWGDVGRAAEVEVDSHIDEPVVAAEDSVGVAVAVHVLQEQAAPSGFHAVEHGTGGRVHHPEGVLAEQQQAVGGLGEGADLAR
ncbi:MAG: hypothetical protein ABIO70_20000 [Pseudomonadota bacterium]